LQFSEVLVKGRKLFHQFSGKHEDLLDRKFDQTRFQVFAVIQPTFVSVQIDIFFFTISLVLMVFLAYTIAPC